MAWRASKLVCLSDNHVSIMGHVSKGQPSWRSFQKYHNRTGEKPGLKIETQIKSRGDRSWRTDHRLLFQQSPTWHKQISWDKSMKMVNVELGNEMWNVKCELWGQRNSESPTGIEPMTSQTHGGCSIHWATRTHREQGHLTEFMWQASCILLGSALSNSSWAVISEWRWWMLSLVMNCERCRWLRYFLCPALVSCWIIHLS